MLKNAAEQYKMWLRIKLAASLFNSPVGSQIHPQASVVIIFEFLDRGWSVVYICNQNMLLRFSMSARML